MGIENKHIALAGVILLAVIQYGAWWLGFDGQVTIAVTGGITYLMGIISKAGIDKIKKK